MKNIHQIIILTLQPPYSLIKQYYGFFQYQLHRIITGVAEVDDITWLASGLNEYQWITSADSGS